MNYNMFKCNLRFHTKNLKTKFPYGSKQIETCHRMDALYGKFLLLGELHEMVFDILHDGIVFLL